MTAPDNLRVFILDDEPLAVDRLAGLVQAINGLTVAGRSIDPREALRFLEREAVDILFLDIQMPGLNGFEVLAQLSHQPVVVFTTAYDEYALRAFEVNSVDYLLKPVDPSSLQRAVDKVRRLRSNGVATSGPEHIRRTLAELADALASREQTAPRRISTRIGDRIEYVELDRITHFYADGKLTFAATSDGRRLIVDYTIADLEAKLSPTNFLRIHRSSIANLTYVTELHRWFGGKMLIRMNDPAKTELNVARDRVQSLKEHLGL